MELDGLMFGCVSSFPFAVTVGYVRAKAYVCPRIMNDIVMYVVVKGGVSDIIGHGRTKNGIVLYESHQY